MNEITKWDEYWEASKLSLAGAVEFGDRVRNFTPLSPPPEPYAQSGPEYQLPRKNTRLTKLTEQRHSTRAFSAEALTVKDLGTIFAAFRTIGDRRTYPSAGGLYPIHVFALALNVVAPWNMTAVRYEPSLHALATMGPLDSAEDVEMACSLERDIHPQLIVVFVIDMDEATRKYGERAGRFALIEVGHAAQNLALVIAEAGLAGYEVGGLQDEAVKRALGLNETNALIAHGYACGRPER